MMAPRRRTPRSPAAARRPGGTPRPAGRPGPVRRPRESAAEPETQQARGGSRLTGRAAVLLLVMVVLLISYASSLRAWLQQRDDLAQARSEIEKTQQSIERLARVKWRIRDPVYGYIV